LKSDGYRCAQPILLAECLDKVHFIGFHKVRCFTAT
jgi:hypothetical protein